MKTKISILVACLFTLGCHAQKLAVSVLPRTTATSNTDLLIVDSDNGQGGYVTKAIKAQDLFTGNGPTVFKNTHTFAPDQVPGLFAWLRPDLMTNAIQGTPITLLTDGSGNGNHASNSLSLAPTFATNIINGHPAILFNGSSQFLTTPSGGIMNSNYAFFVVCRKTIGGGAIVVPMGLGVLGQDSTSYIVNGAGYYILQYATNGYNAGNNAFGLYQVDEDALVILEFRCQNGTNAIFVNGRGVVDRTGVLNSSIFGGGIIGMEGNYTHYFQGYIGDVLIFTNCPSIKDNTRISQYLLENYMPGPHLSFYGDSLTASAGGNIFSNIVAQLALINGGANVSFHYENLGVGARTMAMPIYNGVYNFNDQMNNAPIELTWPDTGHGQDVAIIENGSNDAQYGNTTNALMAGYSNYCILCHNLGSKTILCDILPRGDTSIENFRLPVNAWLAANWTNFCDGVVQVSQDPVLGNTNSFSNTNIFAPDHIHLANAGSTLYALDDNAVLQTILRPWLGVQLIFNRAVTNSQSGAYFNAGGLCLNNVTFTNAPTFSVTNTGPSGFAVGTTAPRTWLTFTNNSGATFSLPGY